LANLIYSFDTVPIADAKALDRKMYRPACLDDPTKNLPPFDVIIWQLLQAVTDNTVKRFNPIQQLLQHQETISHSELCSA
jgi:hypothetical protein